MDVVGCFDARGEGDLPSFYYVVQLVARYWHVGGRRLDTWTGQLLDASAAPGPERLPAAAPVPTPGLRSTPLTPSSKEAVIPQQSVGDEVSSIFNDISLLFSNSFLNDIKQDIISGKIPRQYSEIISIDEQAIITYYTTEAGYKDFNLALRGILPITPHHIAQEKLLNRALQSLPKYKGNVLRGTGKDEIEIFANASIGEVITYKNFVSTSTNEDIADDFMHKKKGECVLIIKCKDGVRVTEMSSMPWEEEILFPSKSSFKITGKSYRPRFSEDDPVVREIYLEQV